MEIKRGYSSMYFNIVGRKRNFAFFHQVLGNSSAKCSFITLGMVEFRVHISSKFRSIFIPECSKLCLSLKNVNNF